jgi:hypothetical protein
MPLSKSEVRSIKDDGYYHREREWDEDEQEYVTVRSTQRHLIDSNDPHAPNKNESKELRRIMAKTHLTEEQVREHPKYRRQLSKAQKVPEKKREQTP